MKNKLLFAASLCATTSAHASCGLSFCVMNANWDTQGLVNNEGLRVNLRYSYARADTLRGGSSKAVKPSPADPALLGIEVESMRTINQSLNLDFDYPINCQWRVAVGLPVVACDHAHQIGDPALTIVEQNQFTELGDIRVVGNYKSDFSDRMSGSCVRFGLKLPTGKVNWEFISGSGTPAKSGLQPDSGSIYLVLGAYYYQHVANLLYSWFVSGIGAKVNPHSGMRSLNLSPGLSFAVTPKTKLYSFVQLPIYKYANSDPNWTPGSPIIGQLTASRSISLCVIQTF